MSTNNQGVHVTKYVKITESEYLALVLDRDRLDALDKLESRERWNLERAHGCVFLCRNSTSGFSDVRKAIDAGIARLLPNAMMCREGRAAGQDTPKV